MATVFLDTAPIIYLVEGADEQRAKVKAQLLSWTEAGMGFGTSAITLMELLIHPKKKKDLALQSRYRSLLTSFMSVPFEIIDEVVADRAAEYRAEIGLRAPDALQAACAVTRGYDLFYTNDRRMRRVKALKVVLVG